MKNGKLQPFLADILQAKKDCDDLRECFEKYNIRREDQIYDLSNDPTEKEVKNTIMSITKKIQQGRDKTPRENYLVIFFFAGHGILKDGGQHVLYNEFNPRSKFYKTLNAEQQLRHMANKLPNSYIIGIFACCRQLYNAGDMTGCVEYDETAEEEKTEKLDEIVEEVKEQV